MELRHAMEIWMTVALALYLGAFFLAKRSWRGHVALALFGFVADMYATYLMMQMNLSHMSLFVLIHTMLAVVAIGTFFIQAWLGYKAKWGGYHIVTYKRWHVSFAKKAFLPIWLLAYFSGFLFLL